MVFCVIDFLQKRTNKFDFTTMIPQVDLFSFILEEINNPKNHFENNWFHRSKDFKAMKAGKLAIWPRLSCPYSEITIMDLPSSVVSKMSFCYIFLQMTSLSMSSNFIYLISIYLTIYQHFIWKVHSHKSLSIRAWLTWKWNEHSLPSFPNSQKLRRWHHRFGPFCTII